MPPKIQKFIKDYPVKIYKCGLKAGDNVRLRKILKVSGLGRSDTSIHRAGEVWKVCRGTPGIVWLRQANGEMHTWDDDRSIFESFELIGTASPKATAKRKAVNDSAKRRRKMYE
jgi:hypothetical protein